MTGLPTWLYIAAVRRPIFCSRRKDIIMFNLLKSLVSRIDLPRIAEVERAYLDASVSRYDLERRQREVENGLFRRSSFDF
jgi:hypothetical protein